MPVATRKKVSVRAISLDPPNANQLLLSLSSVLADTLSDYSSKRSLGSTTLDSLRPSSRALKRSTTSTTSSRRTELRRVQLASFLPAGRTSDLYFRLLIGHLRGQAALRGARTLRCRLRVSRVEDRIEAGSCLTRLPSRSLFNTSAYSPFHKDMLAPLMAPGTCGIWAQGGAGYDDVDVQFLTESNCVRLLLRPWPCPLAR